MVFIPDVVCGTSVGAINGAAALLDSTGGYLVGPYPEARQCGGTEGVAERDVGGVAATRDQDPADALRVVAGVEGMPLPAEEHLEPGREIHRLVCGQS